jgi:L-lactate dehydrogenase complex protein LldF
MGSVLSPSLFGIKKTKDLPNASTFCGRCDQVCPMRIPLTTMMRYYRDQEFEQRLAPITFRSGLKTWAFFAKHPWLYHSLLAIVASTLALLGRKKGRLHSLSFARGWTEYRDFPAPTGKTFHQLWKKHNQSEAAKS